MLISRRLVAGGLGLVGVGLAQRFAQAAPTEFHVGYQKAGLLSVAKEQGVFERRLKSVGVEGVKWSEFEVGPPMMDAISAGAIDFGWVGDAPVIIAQSAGVINQSISRVIFFLTWRISRDSRSTCKRTMRVNWITQP